jgi:hypothetical protein
VAGAASGLGAGEKAYRYTVWSEGWSDFGYLNELIGIGYLCSSSHIPTASCVLPCNTHSPKDQHLDGMIYFISANISDSVSLSLSLYRGPKHFLLQNAIGPSVRMSDMMEQTGDEDKHTPYDQAHIPVRNDAESSHRQGSPSNEGRFEIRASQGLLILKHGMLFTLKRGLLSGHSLGRRPQTHHSYLVFPINAHKS